MVIDFILFLGSSVFLVRGSDGNRHDYLRPDGYEIQVRTTRG